MPYRNNLLSCLLALTTLLAACASYPVAAPCPKLPAVPKELMAPPQSPEVEKRLSPPISSKPAVLTLLA